MSSFRYRSRAVPRAFSLTEMLVVIAVISTLLAISLPALTAIRDNSRQVTCANNMRQIGLALVTYEKEFRALPPGDGKTSDAQVRWLWPVFLLPALDQNGLYRKLDLKKDPFKQNYDSNPARTTDIGAYYPLNVVLPFFICPGSSRAELSRGDDNRLPTNQGGAYIKLGCMDYAGIQGVDSDVPNNLTGDRYNGNEGMFQPMRSLAKNSGPQEADPRVTLKQARDGLRNTILLTECTGRAQQNYPSTSGARHGAWAISENSLIVVRRGRGVNAIPNIQDQQQGLNSWDIAWKEDQIYSDHRGGANAIMCDTSVQFLSDLTASSVVAALASKAGGEKLFKDGEGWYIDTTDVPGRY